MAVSVMAIYTNLLSLHLGGGRVKPQDQSYVKVINIVLEVLSTIQRGQV